MAQNLPSDSKTNVIGIDVFPIPSRGCSYLLLPARQPSPNASKVDTLTPKVDPPTPCDLLLTFRPPGLESGPPLLSERIPDGGHPCGRAGISGFSLALFLAFSPTHTDTDAEPADRSIYFADRSIYFRVKNKISL